MPAEIILIGGASILVNYGFRKSTADIDAIIQASTIMKEAINHVGDRFDLPHGWFNSDFKKTASYTTKLIEHSTYHRTYSNIVTIRTISNEYLIAMKLMAGRDYKYDLSDIIGILGEHKRHNNPIDHSLIEKAVCVLYGSWDALPESSIDFIKEVLNNEDFDILYDEYRNRELVNRTELLEQIEDQTFETGTNTVQEVLEKYLVD